MAKIFISYSRVDVPFIKPFVERLQDMFRSYSVWYDDRLLGGDKWWDEILKQIANCDIFIYLLSNDSVSSLYCQAEFAEARRLQKRIITIQIRDRTKLSNELSDIQYVDMKAGIDDAKAQARLVASINQQVSLIPKRRPKPLSPTPVSRPKVEQNEQQIAQGDVDTPTLVTPLLPLPGSYVGQITIGIIVTIIGGLILSFIFSIISQSNTDGNGTATPDIVLTTAAPETSVALATEEAIQTDDPTEEPLITETPTETESPTSTHTPTPTETASPTPTLTPTESPTVSEVDIENAAKTVVAQGTNNALTMIAEATSTARTATAFANETATVNAAETIVAAATETAAQATAYQVATETKSANETATATLWTKTPTPDYTASVTALVAQWANETATQNAINATATATLWTDTPTATYTPSKTLTPTSTNTNTPTPTPTYTPSPTPTPTNTQTPLELALERAHNFTGTNDDWKNWYPNGFSQTFNGVEMVLVPKGCFMMGSDEGDGDEKPVHEQCFDAPFWIDKTEVTNAQFGSAGCEQWSSEPNQPRNCVTWFEARDFCASRDAHLPTEREWEYAARGVSNWIYPWGNEFAPENVVYGSNSDNKTANVGSRAGGASWVGALDMSGNVWEWTGSWYAEYPYDQEDGREDLADNSSNNNYTARVLRGGSFSYYAFNLRAADRSRGSPDYTFGNRGFRCVSSLN